MKNQLRNRYFFSLHRTSKTQVEWNVMNCCFSLVVLFLFGPDDIGQIKMSIRRDANMTIHTQQVSHTHTQQESHTHTTSIKRKHTDTHPHIPTLNNIAQTKTLTQAEIGHNNWIVFGCCYLKFKSFSLISYRSRLDKEAFNKAGLLSKPTRAKFWENFHKAQITWFAKNLSS